MFIEHRRASVPLIEVENDGVTIRVSGWADAKTVAAVIRALARDRPQGPGSGVGVDPLGRLPQGCRRLGSRCFAVAQLEVDNSLL
jgi:hypothetical protein